MFVRSALVAVLLLVATACSNAGTPAASDGPASIGVVVSVPNQGGSMEGHTPTAFAGTGTGLFVGDNLNPSFPEGVGVQTYLTFALPAGVDASDARLTSDVLTTTGSPFTDLGALFAEPVIYESFGPDLYDLAATGDPVACRVTGETSVECDVTRAVQQVTEQGYDTVQFRLRFERPGDNDGQADLAMFYRSDSNTNEPGLFTLIITPAR